MGRSIDNIAYQRGSDLIVLGWRGRRKRASDLALGSIIDRVVEHAPCDVAVVKTETTIESEKVLVPIAGGPHTEFAVEMGAAFARAGADLTLLTVAEERRSAQALLKTQRDRLIGENFEISTGVIEGDDIARAVVDHAEEKGTELLSWVRQPKVIFGAPSLGRCQNGLARSSVVRSSW